MLDQDDLKWIATTSTDLNSILQQVARYCDLARRHKGEHNYIDLLGERVELAAKTAQGLFDRVTTKILAGAVGKGAPPPVPGTKGLPTFTVVPTPTRSAPPPAAAVKATNERITESPNKAPSRSGGTQKASPTIGDKIPPDVKLKNPKGNREYLLFIEDEPEVAELASEMLADEGYKVILAHDGFEALRIYEQMGRQIGLVILDFFLPVMDGDAVFDELRALNPDINVVLSSGFAEQSKIGAMLARGLRGFIPKPYTREKLLEQVRSTLDAERQVAR
jgi:CheY-like chemotaxis protein